jgi:hypothetical protein
MGKVIKILEILSRDFQGKTVIIPNKEVFQTL